jgi:hypothetical protein
MEAHTMICQVLDARLGLMGVREMAELEQDMATGVDYENQRLNSSSLLQRSVKPYVVMHMLLLSKMIRDGSALSLVYKPVDGLLHHRAAVTGC